MSKGRFGIHGGQYIPETLMNAVLELEEAYNHYKTTRNSTVSSQSFSMNTQEDHPVFTMRHI